MPKPWYIELYEHFPDYDQEPYTQGTQGEVDFIEQVIGHDRSKIILDVGCGTGRHALELARRGYSVVGLDLSESLRTQRYYTCPELRWLLKQAGFRAAQFFGVTAAEFDRQVGPSKDHFEIGAIAER